MESPDECVIPGWNGHPPYKPSHERIPLRAEAEKLSELAQYLTDKIENTGLTYPVTFQLGELGSVTVRQPWGVPEKKAKRTVEIEFEQA